MIDPKNPLDWWQRHERAWLQVYESERRKTRKSRWARAAVHYVSFGIVSIVLVLAVLSVSVRLMGVTVWAFAPTTLAFILLCIADATK